MEKTLILGGDVSKGMSNFVLENLEGKVLDTNFQLDDTPKGHKLLSGMLKKAFKEYGGTRIVAGVESTGGYENNWYRMLKEMPEVDVLRINPRPVFHQGKAENLQNVTDGVSASLIASYLRKNLDTLDFSRWECDTELAHARQLNRYLHSITKQGTRQKNMLEKLLYSNMPEILPIKGEKYAEYFLEMLRKYPSREAILRAGVSNLKKIRFLTGTKAKTIVEALRESVGTRATMGLELAIGGLAEDIQSAERKLKKLKDTQYNFVKKLMGKELELLDSIDGLGRDSAVTLLLEIGDVKRFPKASSLVAFWGMNPTMKQSGDKTYRAKMSKFGNPLPRAVLYMSAMNVLRNPMFKDIYAGQRAKGKKHNQALVVVMSKLTRVIYGMLKTGKPFDPEVDQKNRNKTPKLKDNGEANRKKEERRYQDEKSPAPISARQRRKRRTTTSNGAKDTKLTQEKESIKNEILADVDEVKSIEKASKNASS